MVDEKVMQVIGKMREGATKTVAELGTVGEAIDLPARSGKRHAIIYRPENPTGKDPVFFNIHGGGFIYGAPELDDEFCDRVRRETGAVVINPSYRLAPENMFPSDKEDVYDIVKHVRDNAAEYGIDPDRMAVGGHSAGGNIATVVAMMSKEEAAFQFKCVIMDYPTVDMDTDAHDKPLPEGCLPADLAAMFDACYRKPEDGKNPHLSPLFATQEELAGMPPHIVLTAEGDSLCFEGEEYAKHLMAAGTEVTGRRFMGVGHGYSMPRYGLGTSPLARQRADEAQAMMIEGLKKYL